MNLETMLALYTKAHTHCTTDSCLRLCARWESLWSRSCGISLRRSRLLSSNGAIWGGVRGGLSRRFHMPVLGGCTLHTIWSFAFLRQRGDDFVKQFVHSLRAVADAVRWVPSSEIGDGGMK